MVNQYSIQGERTLSQRVTSRVFVDRAFARCLARSVDSARFALCRDESANVSPSILITHHVFFLFYCSILPQNLAATFNSFIVPYQTMVYSHDYVHSSKRTPSTLANPLG